MRYLKLLLKLFSARSYPEDPLPGPFYLENRVVIATSSCRSSYSDQSKSLRNVGHREASLARPAFSISSFERRERKGDRKREREREKIRAVTHYPRDSIPYPRRERKRGGKKSADDENRRRSERGGRKGSDRLTSQPHERERGTKWAANRYQFIEFRPCTRVFHSRSPLHFFAGLSHPAVSPTGWESPLKRNGAALQSAQSRAFSRHGDAAVLASLVPLTRGPRTTPRGSGGGVTWLVFVSRDTACASRSRIVATGDSDRD